jgi:hypothetical protein
MDARDVDRITNHRGGGIEDERANSLRVLGFVIKESFLLKIR